MAETGERKWSKQEGVTEIVAGPGIPPWIAKRARHGGFIADDLLAAAGTSSDLVINTKAGSLISGATETLRKGFAAFKHTSLPTKASPIQTILDSGQATIVSGLMGTLSRWDSNSGNWIAINDPTFLNNRSAVDTEGLFFQFLGGKWRAEIEMETLNSEVLKRRKFKWSTQNYFPFDVA